jgi:thioredoxin reductase (NADPH)
MRAQAEHVGTRMVADHIMSVDLSRRPFVLNGDSGTTYTCDALIIATGAEARWLNLPSEQKFRGYGVSACATCDGFFYKNREVVVIGGGNTAVEEALFLTNFATKVTLIHRRDELRAEKILQNRLFANEKVAVVWDSVLEDVIGTETIPPAVTGVRVRNVKTGTVSELKADGVFVAIGHAPSTELLGGQLKLKPNGYVWTAPDSTVTSIPGVFAAGDISEDIFRQAVTAASLGCMAALEAEKYLAVAEHQTERATEAAE